MGSFICCPSRSSADYIDITNDVFSQELNDITRNKFENVVEIRKSSKRYYFEEETDTVSRYCKTEDEENFLMEVLNRHEILNKYDSYEKKMIINTISRKCLVEGEVVLRNNDKSNIFIVLKYGEIKIKSDNRKTITLKEQESFGLNNIYNPTVSDYSIVAEKESEIFLIRSDTFFKSVNKTKDNKVNAIFLKRIPFFSNLPLNEFNSILKNIEESSYNMGDFIIRKGDSFNKLFVMKSGSAKAYDWSDFETNYIYRRELYKISKKEIFGEFSILNKTQREIDVVATENTQCLVLNVNQIDEILFRIIEELKMTMKARIMNKIAYISKISLENRITLADYCNIRTIKENCNIDVESGNEESMYLILEGEVEIIDDYSFKESTKLFLKKNEYIIRENRRKYKSRTDLVLLEIKDNEKMSGIKGEILNQQRKRIILERNELFSLMKNNYIPLNIKTKILDLFSEIKYLCSHSKIELEEGFYVVVDGEIEIGGKKLGRNDPFEINRENKVKLYCDSTFFKIPKSEISGVLNIYKTNINEYVIVNNIGSGINGFVYRVYIKNNKNYYALKQMPKTDINRLNIDRIVNEKVLLFNICHPFIINILNTYQDDIYLYLLEEFGEASDLRTLMALFPSNILTDYAVQFFTAQITIVLEYLHSNSIIHRDIKPENFILFKNGFIKLCDFGSSTSKERTISISGTSNYIAPEVWAEKGYNRSSDYWSLGVLVYEMATGKLPFDLSEETVNNNLKIEQCTGHIIRDKNRIPENIEARATVLIKESSKNKTE